MTIYNAIGRSMNVIATRAGNKHAIDVSRLAAGVYAVQYASAGGSYEGTFVKE